MSKEQFTARKGQRGIGIHSFSYTIGRSTNHFLLMQRVMSIFFWGPRNFSVTSPPLLAVNFRMLTYITVSNLCTNILMEDKIEVYGVVLASLVISLLQQRTSELMHNSDICGDVYQSPHRFYYNTRSRFSSPLTSFPPNPKPAKENVQNLLNWNYHFSFL